MKENSLSKSAYKSMKGLFGALPIILGTILLTSLISASVPKSFYTTIFSKSTFLDSLIGAIVGSISTGNPITSYILGGEMLSHGIGLFAVTSFLVSWVTVGLVQLPAESLMLGKKFSIIRNITAFILSIIVALTTVFLWSMIK